MVKSIAKRLLLPLLQVVILGILVATNLALADVAGSMATVVTQGLAVVVVLLLIGFHLCWTYFDGIDRLIVWLASAVSLIFAMSPAWTLAPFKTFSLLSHRSIRNAFTMLYWLFIFGCLVVVLVVVQVRRPVPDKRVSQAERVVRYRRRRLWGAVACVATPGWLFLPYIPGARQFIYLRRIVVESGGPVMPIALSALVAWLVLIVIGGLSRRDVGTWRDAVGVALMQVMYGALAVTCVVVVIQAMDHSYLP
ncbi:MAG: hypothetical protein ACFWT0_00825 [Bifidobacterium crudilactis]|jgi:hypothetical protein|uniref:hypothetical protein n=1 Tax=Bifidobacterium crudilactis TaxID=327277 RepID=UPI003A5C3B9A